MYKHNITQSIGIGRAGAAVAAGTTASNGDVIDVSGASSVVFIALFGTLTSTAATGIKLQAGTQSGGGDMADVTGATFTFDDTNSGKIAISPEIFNPTKRYWRCVVTRGTANAVIDGIIVLLGRPTYAPATPGPNAINTAAPTVMVSKP